MRAWRKEIRGKTLRGPVEFSLEPNPDVSIICEFEDGMRVVVDHITMVHSLRKEFFNTNYPVVRGYGSMKGN